MSATPYSNAKQMDHPKKREIALEAICRTKNITEIAASNQVSRQFVHKQKSTALVGIEVAFQQPKKSTALFEVPITSEWINSAIVSLTLNCRSNYRGIQRFFADNLDLSISLGKIHDVLSNGATTAKENNLKQDLSAIKLAAHDEFFVLGEPILSRIDIQSLYCHLLQKENYRDQETWGINLLDLQKQGFDPERVIADDGNGLRGGHSLVLFNTPCDYDNFHVTRDLKDLRRYFINRVKSLKTDCVEFAKKAQYSAKNNIQLKFQKLLPKTETEFGFMSGLADTIKTLISWMEHDVLNMPGSPLPV